MKRAPLVTTVLAVMAIAQTGNPCWSVSGGPKVALTGEEVVIVWDEANQTEHFVRQAEFKTQAKDFGFLVPVPSVPQVVEVDERAITILRDLAFPPVRNGGGGFTGGFGGGAFGGGGKVSIVKTENVGDYQVTTLTGTTGDAVQNWLKKHRFEFDDEGAEYLDHYIQRHWGFVAFKFRGTPGKQSTKAVRISFRTKQPFYPYKAPLSNWPSDKVKPLTVYFIAATHQRALYEGNLHPWEAKRTELSGGLPSQSAKELIRCLKLAAKDLPARRAVTVFVNGQNKSGYDRDLVFTPDMSVAR